MVTTPKPIFISYASRTGADTARALEAALGPELVYRDASNLRHGHPYPMQLFEALVGAKVILCILDEAYTESWFCLAELQVALAPLEASGDANDTLRRLVIALPAGSKDKGLQELPASLRSIQWPQWSDRDAIIDLIKARIEAPEGSSLRERLDPRHLDDLRNWLNEEAMMRPRQALRPGQIAVNCPPIPMGRFYGRVEELDAIHDRLLSMTGTGICALVSPGGAGKSRLAREYVWRYTAEAYPGGCIWIDAAQPDAAETQFYRALATLIPNLPDLSSLKMAKLDVKQRLQDKLAERKDLGPLLWVIDNVPEPVSGERPRPLTDWYLELPGQIAVLATARMRQSPREINFTLGNLSRTAAIAMLSHELPVSLLAPALADAIAAAVGDWPLALELLNRSFADRALNPTEFLSQHQRFGAVEALDEAMEVLRDQVPEGALRGVTETFILSYECLPVEAQLLASILACGAPMEPLPSAWLAALGMQAPPGARVALHARSFVNGPNDASFGAMHPLLSDFLRARDTSHSGLGHATESMTRLIAQIRVEDATCWDAADRLAPHTLAISQHTDQTPEAALSLLRWVMDLCIEQGRFAESVQLGQQELARWPSLPPAAGQAFLQVQSRIGISLGRAGRLQEAEELLHNTVLQQEVLLGDEHPDTIRTRGLLSWSLFARGDLAGARLLREAVLELQERVLGPEHFDTLRTRGNLAMTLLWMGESAAGQKLMESVLAAQERHLGPEHPDTFKARANLAKALADQGEFDAARNLLAEVLAVQGRVLGEEHPDALASRANLSLMLLDAGDLSGARQLLDSVLSAQISVLGARHPRTLMTQGNLAVILLEQGDWSGALHILEAVLIGQKQILGADHPDTLMMQGNLTWGLMLQENWEQARQLAELTLSDARRILGAHHRTTHFAERYLIEILRSAGSQEAALVLAEESLASHIAAHGANALETLRCQYELAVTRLAVGKCEEGQSTLEAVLDHLRAKVDTQHPQRNQAAWTLFQLLRAGCNVAAEPLRREELDWLVNSTERPQYAIQRQIREQLLG